MSTDQIDGQRDGTVVQLRPAEVQPEVQPEAAEPDVLVGKVVGRGGARRPIVPEPLRPKNLRSTARFHAGLRWHQARFHGFRSPLYLLAALLWAVVGIARLAYAQLSWWWLTEQTYLRAEAIAANDPRTWQTLHKHAREVRLVRGLVLLGELALLGIAAGCVAAYAPWWAWPPIAAAVIPGARLDRPPGGPADREDRHRPAGVRGADARDHRAGAGQPEHRADHRRAEG